MLVHNPDPTPVTQWVPFADWADGRVLLGDRRPTMADLDYHLTTLFPPVRPRGFLEIRYLDSVPDAVWPAVVFTLATLLDDPVAADIAAEATESVATAWDRAAQVGLADRAAARSGPAVRAGRGGTRACRGRGIHGPARAFGRTGTQPGRRLRRPGSPVRDRGRGHPTGPRRAVTAREMLAGELTKARDRTLRLVDFDDAELRRQYDPLMSPLVWDLAHIGQQEELWLLRGGDPDRPGLLSPQVDKLYDAFVHSRASRVDLPLLPPDDARTYCATVRGKALDALDALPDGHPDAFTFGMVISHENQHDETMLQALNLRSGAPLLDRGTALPAGRAGVAGTSVLVPAGEFVLGVDAATEPYSLDNERPAHVVDVPAFRIGRVPVTNGEWQQFIDDGGYHQRPLVVACRLGASQPGRPDRAAVLERRRHPHPVRPRRGHPRRRTGPARHLLRGRGLRGMGRVRGCPPRSSGRRPARGIRTPGRRRRYPWGAAEPTAALANLGGDALRPAPVGAYPAGASAYGAEQMLGDVWEWTTSPLRPWPGFTPMVYDSTPRRSSRASPPATTGCCAAGRGRWRRASCGPASATGTTRSAGRSSPACAWPGTCEPKAASCVGTWRGSVSRCRWRRWCSIRRPGCWCSPTRRAARSTA